MTSVYEYLIIGGGIAGVTAAETIRGVDANGRIGIISAEPHLPYSRVLLPAYVKNKIARERVFLRKQKDFARLRIDFLRGSAAASVDAAALRVALADGKELTYGKLLIAAGGRVRPWPPGSTADRIFRLQTIDDADRLSTALDTGAISRPLVIGSSFIALELIEIFLRRGVVPRALIRGAHFFDSVLDRAGAALLHENLERHGISPICGDEATAVEPEGNAMRIQTRRFPAAAGDESEVLKADAVAVGIGLDRALEFLTRSGIICGNGGVLADAFLETNIPGVFAAGDIAAYFDPIAGRHRIVGNWTNAVLHGTRAGLNMAGDRAPFSAVPSYSIMNLGIHIAVVGECDGALQAVSRSDPESRQYERFFLRDGALAGAFLINRPADKAIAAELIGRGIEIAPHADRLHDMAFDIRTLSAVP